jgi:hypothetical protein
MKKARKTTSSEDDPKEMKKESTGSESGGKGESNIKTEKEEKKALGKSKDVSKDDKVRPEDAAAKRKQLDK